MRAINLIPADSRSGGAGGAAGRSGGAVYAFLGGLAGLVVMAAVWGMTSAGLSHKRGELAQIKQDVAQVQARAGNDGTPGAVQQARLARTATVRALAQQRLDWAGLLDALSRTLPADTTLTNIDGGADTNPGSAPTATGAAAAPTGPTIQLGGCAPTQRAVALLMPRLRTIPGVALVQLQSTIISTQGASQPPTGSVECPGVAFVMLVGIDGPAPAAPAPGTTAAVPAGTTPVSATTPSTATTAVPGTPTPGSGG